MKKILFILHYPPPIHGAAMVGEYIRESSLVNTSFSCEYINLSTSARVDTVGKRSWSKLKRFFEIILQTYRGIKKFKPDQVYLTLTSTGIGFFKDALVVCVIKLFKVQIIYHFHNKGVSLNQHRFLYNLAYKFVFKNARVILLSSHLFNDVKKYVPSSKVSYCANGVPEQAIGVTREASNDKTNQILFLSNLIESKGVYVLLKACSILQARKIDFKCLFVGGEGDITAEKFQKKVTELSLENVFYLGKKYDKDKDEIYRQADIFALPTFYSNECFPLVLLEAMQYNLPVVSTPEGGIPAMIKEGETGFLVQQNDANELADKLEYLINKPELRHEMGNKGRNYYLKEFTLRKFEENIIEILNKI